MISQLGKKGYLAVILIFPLIFYLIPIITGKALFWGTPSLQFIPWQTLAWEQFDHGIMPLWNPYNGMGAPLLANYQLGFFYPPNWLFYLFYKVGGAPTIAWGYSIMLYLHLAWSGIGMYKLTSRLGLKPFASVISSLAFACCGFLISRSGFFSLVFAAAWLPWVIWAVSKIAIPLKRENEKTTFSLLAIVIITMQLLAGHAQISWYTALLAFAWVCVGGYLNGGIKKVLKALIFLAATYLFAFFLAAIQILPTFEYLMESQRSSAVEFDTALSYSFWPWRLLTMFAPDLFGNPGTGTYWGYGNYWEDANYIGVLPILLVISTLFLLRRKRNGSPARSGYKPMIVFCWIVSLVIFILALGRNTPIFPFLYEHIPTFSLFNGPTRFMILVDFCLCLLAGIAVHHWSSSTGKTLRWIRNFTVAGSAVTIGALAAWLLLKSIDPSIIKSVMIAGFWMVGSGILALTLPRDKLSSRHKLWKWGVIVWIGVDLVLANIALIPVIDSNFYKPMASNIDNNANAGRIYISIHDDHLFKFARFVRFRSFEPLEDWNNIRQIMLPDLNILDHVYFVNNFDPFVPARYAGLMKMLEEGLELPGFMNIGKTITRDVNDPQGFTTTTSLAQGRVKWYNCSIFVDNEESAKKELLAGGGLDKVILENSEQGNKCFPGEPASIKVIVDDPLKMAVEVQSNSEGWLFVADIYYPGWAVHLDGKETTMLRANYAFRAVEIPSGNHTVQFIYSPKSFIFGTIISIISIMLLCFAAALRNFRRPKNLSIAE